MLRHYRTTDKDEADLISENKRDNVEVKGGVCDDVPSTLSSVRHSVTLE